MTYTVCGHKVPYEDRYIKDKEQAEKNKEILEGLKEYMDQLSAKLGNISSWASFYQVGKWKSHPFANYKKELDAECINIDEYINKLGEFIELCENKITINSKCQSCIEDEVNKEAEKCLNVITAD